MDNKTRLLLLSLIILTAVIAFINIYAAGIVFFLSAAFFITYLIMQDSRFMPDIVAEFQADGKGIVIRNAGTAAAKRIHVSLVPENIEYDAESLLPDEVSVHPLDRMIATAKIVISFENEAGEEFLRSYQISSGIDTYDPFKPLIPLFRWK